MSERDLVQRLQGGDREAWAAFIERYNRDYKRMLHRRALDQLGHAEDAEDCVQESFFRFLAGLSKFRGETSIRNYLFTILDGRIKDALRRRQRRAGETSGGLSAAGPLAAGQQTVSAYFRGDEAYRLHLDALSTAIGERVEAIKRRKDFAELRVVEMLFYAGYAALPRNKVVAEAAGVTAARVGRLKHEWLRAVGERARQALATGPGGRPSSAQELWESPAKLRDMLTDAWERRRPSCPKPSTLARHYLLGALDDAGWAEHVRFHVERLGCRFCRAEVEAMRRDGGGGIESRAVRSAVGFLPGGSERPA